MNKRTRPLTAYQEATLAFLKRFGRCNTACPSLQQVADELGTNQGQTAREHIKGLVRRGLVEKRPDRRYRVVDEPAVPVIEVTKPADPEKPLFAEPQIIETFRGVLAETFEPVPDFLVLVSSTSGSTKLLAVREDTEPPDETTVIARLGDEIVVGKLEKRYLKGEVAGKARRRRIDRTHPEFRIEGMVIGEITARQSITQG